MNEEGRPPVGRRVARSALRVLIALAGVLGLLLLTTWLVMIRMPGCSHAGPLPALSDQEQALAQELRRHVEALATTIGPRSLQEPDGLEAAAAYVLQAFQAGGLQARREEFAVQDLTAANLVAELPGADPAAPLLVVGAHYDTVWTTPGADDNATGVAALLVLGRLLRTERLARTVRLVAFVNEEPPFFQREPMGSLVHARGCQARGERIAGMLSLEMLGTYLDAPGSQQYPPPLSWFYPARGDFVAFVGDLGSRALVHRAIDSFRAHASFPSEGVAIFGALPGIGYSDHWSFWQIGVPAIMVTDTAFFRTEHYHLASDTPDRLDFERMARVVAGLARVVADLAGDRGTE
ncbi:MAG TPA: M28 family peptidase [Myxococcota bacterium]|nr:M28 family peptidase [Myxococcota bacterium]HRY92709.1 M28 family peptidase [Myxococcota bacterium]HSA24742.1 M28 family peptidase [Myxococcota bacterium]